MNDHSSSDELRESVRTDLQKIRESGAPPLGHLVGLHRTETADDRFGLAFDPSRPAMKGGPGLLEVSMLADLALGGALRNEVGLEVPMPTVSMTVQLTAKAASRVSTADGEVTAVTGRSGTARSRLFSAEGEPIGDALGVFALPPLPFDGAGTAMPWDSWTATAGNTGTPGGAASMVEDLDRIVAHALGRPEQAWAGAYIAEHMSDRGPDAVLRPTMLMANRFGNIQGGVLLAAAVNAAVRQSDFTASDLASTSIEFIGAVRVDEQLVAENCTLRHGGRSLFSEIRLFQSGKLCCHVTAVFRR